ASAVEEVIGQPGPSESVATRGLGDSSRLGSPLDHPERIVAGHRFGGQLLGPSSAEDIRFSVAVDPSGLYVVVEVLFGVVVGGQLVLLSAFLAPSEVPALAVLEVVLDPHPDGSGHPREAVDHDTDEGPVPEADEVRFAVLVDKRDRIKE